jgi:hypothetical protein
MHELQDRFGADAWLHPRIVLAPAKFDAGTAKWDGATHDRCRPMPLTPNAEFDATV